MPLYAFFVAIIPEEHSSSLLMGLSILYRKKLTIPYCKHWLRGLAKKLIIRLNRPKRATNMDNPDSKTGDPKTTPELDDLILHGNLRVMRSEELLQGQRELIILHGSHIYRLIETRNGKLILQK